jgi:hypothetical protein
MSTFLVKAQYSKQQENGNIKQVTEPFLLVAHTFGHAEERAFQEITVNGDLRITAIAHQECEAVFINEDGDTFFKAVAEMIDPENEKAKVFRKTFFIVAGDVKSATTRIEAELENWQSYVGLVSVSKTAIQEYFPLTEK